MKKLFIGLFLSLALASLARALPSGVSSIPFTTSQAQFASGDSITIQDVLASSPNLAIGDTVVVRGTYTLQSHAQALLMVSLTSSGPAQAVSPTSFTNITSGSGAFELDYAIQQTGSLHVTFYAKDATGASFGGIYFASPSQTVTVPTGTAPPIDTTGLTDVPFTTSQAKFASGDSITITEVLASSPNLAPGDTVMVRGAYALQSSASALLMVSLTANAPGFTESVSPSSRKDISAGAGTFELAYVITQPGAMHVSFYPGGAGGESFGGVYFMPPGAGVSNGSTNPTGIAINNPVANIGKLGNLSIRSLVGPGEGALVAGVTVTDQERYVLIRGVGPSLSVFGISNFLRKPTLTVYDASGAVIASAGSWSAAFTGDKLTGIALLMSSVGAFPLTAGSDDAVLNLRLVPGSYTVMVASGDGQTGVALLEIYASPTYTLPPPH